MTPEQKQLIDGLLIVPPSGRSRITKEDFLQSFPDAIDSDGRVNTRLLLEARISHDADELVRAINVGAVFGFSSSQETLLCELLMENWHHSHEDIVEAISRTGFADDAAVNALYAATQSVPEYLNFDESRALAVKAIWALGKIPLSLSEAKLTDLARNPNPILRDNARKQLERRSKS